MIDETNGMEGLDAAGGATPQETTASVSPADAGAGTREGGQGGEAGSAFDADTVLGGPPRAPDSYRLEAPEGLSLDDAAVAMATPAFQALNLSNEQAQSLMPVAAEWAKSLQERGQQQLMEQVAAQRREWFEAARGDREIGGGNWDASTARAARALDMLGFPKGSAFRALLDESGLGNHPEMIRAFARVGRAVSEDGFERPGTPSAGRKTDEELFYPGMTRTA
ncbi:hypothetical protein [Flavisphingomonas formosensis]|uniref:hypothetical protein n=1 Tax=Flavisphingomonas formosensis TaxID=861534 RepID=UPI0018DFD0A3|nr:hypothetical protein [Sphingomonas formosensis]